MMSRIRVRFTGAVQGVGFRPTMVRIARKLRLGGTVCNDPYGATVEVEAEREILDTFLASVEEELPPLARIDSVNTTEIAPENQIDFQVVESELGRRSKALVPPDAALCHDCRRDMEDPEDKRFHYEFTTCTNCGPRYSLVHDLPYDRQRTAMACFPLCRSCDHEYRDVEDRRYHAEPVCCPQCGPRLWITNSAGGLLAEGDGAMQRARATLLAGSIIAIKGLGGFQLACRADEIDVVARLRWKKRRATKPFAVMVRDVEAAQALVQLDTEDLQLLSSPKAPVTLAPRLGNSSEVVEDVAPGLDDLGVMLPTTPLHVELFRAHEMPPLIMTSGNLSDEPICRTNREAADRLAECVDYFLFHDRDVVRRVDDSVVRADSSGPYLLRRSRGWIPEPLPLPMASDRPLLAVGGHLQVTACVAVGDQAFPSQHIGDLDTESAREFHVEVIEGLERFLEVHPELIIHDLHPDYPSTWTARRRISDTGSQGIGVQHHVAHIASVLAEHECFPAPSERILGVALDGTGFGPDGTVWGGEWLSLDGDLRWQRLASLEPLPLVGGERAVKEPWRIAAAVLARSGQADLLCQLEYEHRLGERLTDLLRIAESPAWPLSSGAGRLFEAAGSLIAGCDQNGWEGEAAARLEALATTRLDALEPWSELQLVHNGKGVLQLPGAALLVAAAERVGQGKDRAVVAAGFHATFAALSTKLTLSLVEDGFARSVPLGGGCMVNRLLRKQMSNLLKANGLTALLPRRLPAGDGGLSYGQAAIGAVALARDTIPTQQEC
ncbi:MAG: carbamoyltransferase HypF [bacterium]|nr:carbamoyltransferase HypF [bacterium]